MGSKKMVRFIVVSWIVCMTCFADAKNTDDEMLKSAKPMPLPINNKEVTKLVDEQLLKLFGLKRKVNPRKNLHVPEHIWSIYRKWNGEAYDDTDEMVNVVRVLHHDEDRSDYGTNFIQFNMATIPKTESLRKAELHLFKEAPLIPGDIDRVYLHAHLRKRASPRLRRSLVESRNVSSSAWMKFDVTSMVAEWLKNPTTQSKFTIDVLESLHGVRIPSESLNLHRRPDLTNSLEWERKRPFLVVESNDGSKKRTRRAAVGQRIRRQSSDRYHSKHVAKRMHKKANHIQCRRRGFYLDFRKIGWSKQIVSPMGFDMYFCRGICPVPLGQHMNTTNHAIIQNQVNSFDPTLVPPPCCVPTSLGPMSFLYIDLNNHVIVKEYTEIVVEGCGCR